MKKITEIILDTSSSMAHASDVAGLSLLELAQKIFVEEIIPDLSGDSEVYLRVTTGSCGVSSRKTLLPIDPSLMAGIVNKHNPSGLTPLYEAIGAALREAPTGDDVHYRMFILTDGGDNCGIPLSDLTREIDKIKAQIVDLKTLVVQFGKNLTPAERNNAGALASTLGGKTIQVASTAGGTFASVTRELKKGLSISGLKVGGKIEPCYDDALVGKTRVWEELIQEGMTKFQANILYQGGVLSWNPSEVDKIQPCQYEELKFLFALRFKSMIPLPLLQEMLRELKKPYYYSMDCVFWNFHEARWKYFEPKVTQKEVTLKSFKQEELETHVERNRDRFEHIFSRKDLNLFDKADSEEQHYHKEHFYSVKEVKSESYILEHLDLINRPKTKLLFPGDIVEFRLRKNPGRKKPGKRNL